LPNFLGLKEVYTGHVTPRFDDCDWESYWSCRRVLPYLVAHGCKWGKCTFCSHHLTYEGYRSSHMSDVISDLEILSAVNKCEYVSFCDEYLTPSQLRELANGIRSRNLRLRWSTFVRPEPAFKDDQFMHELYGAGCRMLMFGLESGSQRIISAMRKGTKVSNFRPILEACKKANIAIRYDFMVGFPGETLDDVSATYEFIRNNRDVIDTPFSSYSVAAFELRSGIPIDENIEGYRIAKFSNLRGDLDDQYDFEDQVGLTESQRAEWRDKLIRFAKTKLDMELICPQNKAHQLILKDLYDRNAFELPVCSLNVEEAEVIHVQFASGVEISNADGPILIENLTNGGILEVDQRLSGAITALHEGANLHSAGRAQLLWSMGTFLEFISFLHRNDYITLSKSPDTKGIPVPSGEIRNVEGHAKGLPG
jgi:hypothetical protein